MKSFSKTSILRKSCSRVGGSSIFGVRALRKSTKKPFENTFAEKVARTTLKNRFFACLRAPGPLRNPSQIERNRPSKHVAKNTRFRRPVRPRPPPSPPQPPGTPYPYPYISRLGELVGAQRQKAEHEPFTSHFERRSGSSKRLRNARAKTRGEDHATPL